MDNARRCIHYEGLIMKHLMYLAIGALQLLLVMLLVYTVVYLMTHYGAWVFMVPLLMIVSYALGRGFYESIK